MGRKIFSNGKAEYLKISRTNLWCEDAIFSTVTLIFNKNDGNLRNHFFFSNQMSQEEHFEDKTFLLKQSVIVYFFSDFEWKTFGLSDQRFFVTNKENFAKYNEDISNKSFPWVLRIQIL